MSVMLRVEWWQKELIECRHTQPQPGNQWRPAHVCNRVASAIDPEIFHVENCL